MKKLISIFTICAVLATMFVFTAATPASAEITRRTLIWSDEFDGNSLNTSNWVYDVGYGQWGNNELEYYRSGTNNIVVANGELAITAKRESYGGASYTSGRITTNNKRSFTYGTIEARIKMPKGQGLWPAFWMLSNDAAWPNGGELDIMEHINSENTVYGTAHDWNNDQLVSNGGAKYNLDVSQYHVYTIDWTEDYLKWYVDDVLYHTVDVSSQSSVFPHKDLFHKPYYILLNLAVGGDWCGNPTSSTPFPSTMYVDYVRVYENSGSSSIPATGITLKKNGTTVSNNSSTTVSSTASALTFTADVLPANADNRNYTMTVSNPAVATVSGGTVTVNPANATANTNVVITATSQDGSFVARHTVYINYVAPYVPATGITLYKNGTAVPNGGSVTVSSDSGNIVFTAGVNPANATNKNYTLAINNSSVASVSGNTATVVPSNASESTSVVIIATSSDGSFRAFYTVNIDVPQPQPTLPEAYVFKIGNQSAYWTTYDYRFATEVPCQFVDGVTYVPFRVIATAAGAQDVTYDANTSKVTITNAYDMTFVLSMNSTTCTVTAGGQTSTSTLNAAPTFIDGACCLPIRDVSNITFASVAFVEQGVDGYVLVSASELSSQEMTDCINAYNS